MRQRCARDAPAIDNSNSRAMEVQIFGVKKSADTRKALRFFAERRVKTHFVDMNERPASLGELKRFVQKFGLDRLIDKDGKRYEELGLRHARLSDERWLERLADEPLLLRMPLVRSGNALTVGLAEADWKSWTGK
jgi:arsenate reductase (glutaredoxin)